MASRLSQPSDKRGILREWFEAIWVDLNSDGFKDLLVKTKDPNECFNGNSISWWGFAGGRKGYRLVFYDYTLSFRVEPTKSNSYFDLWSRRCNGNACRNTIFQFDGRKYRPRKTWWKPLNNDG